MNTPYEPLVSIIIPCYNREKYISQAIESALNQTYPNTELIVVDDGSSDNSVSVIESYGEQIKLIKQANKGVSSARNTGFSAASGDYIIFLDSDDWLSLDIIESHIKTVLKWPEVDICCADSASIRNTNLSQITPSNWPATPENPLELFLLNPPPFPACEMYKAKTISRLGGYDEDMRAFADSSLRLRIILGGGLVVKTKGGHAVYRPVENSITKNALKLHSYALKLIKRLVAEYGHLSNVKALLKERLIRHRLRMWYHILDYHLSYHPISMLKFSYHFFRISRRDPSYLLFILRDQPWRRDRSNIF